MTVCQISRNDAEVRVREIAKNGWITKPHSGPPLTLSDPKMDADSSPTDIELAARDQIAKFLISKYKGHGLARLVDAILGTQGYTPRLSESGPDKGGDILAAPAPMGFGEPRICVQVKSGEHPLDRPTLDQLVGVM